MVLSSSPTDHECIALVTYGHLERLAFCRIGDASCSWTPLDGPRHGYNQIVFHAGKKLFFGFTRYRELEAWDLHTPAGPRRFLIHNEDFGTESWPFSFMDDEDREIKSDFCWDPQYLVYDHQNQELFIVTRYTAAAVDKHGNILPPEDNLDHEHPYLTLTFDVFRVDFIDPDHVELQYMEPDSLGSRAFFIGSNPGFALSTTDLPELRPHSIYFTDDLTWAYTYRKKLNCGGHDLGIYGYKETSFSRCYYPIALRMIQRILPAPLWFTPDLEVESLA